MTQEPKLKFQVGDVVRIVDTPYMECPFTWVDEMTEYCGKEATITDVFWTERHKTHGYTLDTEDCYCTWCENCFEPPIPDIEESDEDISLLIS